jgi:sec-independent protein translocase protein TatA
MFGFGPSELAIIAVIVLLIFGAKRLPEIGKGVGGAIREFRNIGKEISPDDKSGKGKDPDPQEGKKNGTQLLESNAAEKMLEHVPGVKKVMDVKNKAEKVKELLK